MLSLKLLFETYLEEQHGEIHNYVIAVNHLQYYSSQGLGVKFAEVTYLVLNQQLASYPILTSQMVSAQFKTSRAQLWLNP